MAVAGFGLALAALCTLVHPLHNMALLPRDLNTGADTLQLCRQNTPQHTPKAASVDRVSEACKPCGRTQAIEQRLLGAAT